MLAAFRRQEKVMRTLGLKRSARLSPLLIALIVGCSSHSSNNVAEKPVSSTKNDTASEPALDKPFQLGNQVEKFDPPPLAELIKTVEWVDRPVVSGLDELRKAQEASGTPP